MTDVVQEFIQNEWNLSYVYSLKELPSKSRERKIHAIFSKPTAQVPVPPAVVHIEFTLSPDRAHVKTYQIERERHVFQVKGRTEEPKFNDMILDRIIHRKLQLCQLIDVGDEFTQTRLAPTKYLSSGNSNSEPKPDNSNNHSSNSVVRSAAELEQYLMTIFRTFDITNQGKLSYSDFRNLLGQLKLSIDQDDIDLLCARADENLDGFIEYQEFIPFAVHVLSSLQQNCSSTSTTQYPSTLASFGNDDDTVEGSKSAFIQTQTILLSETIATLRNMLEAAVAMEFPHLSPEYKEKHATELTIDRRVFHRILTAVSVNFTREERNMILALVRTDEGGRIHTFEIEKLIYEIRYIIEQRRHKVLPPKVIQDLPSVLTQMFDKLYPTKTTLTRRQLKAFLTQVTSKFLLTKFQFYALLGETKSSNDLGEYDMAECLPILSAKIQLFFEPEYRTSYHEMISRAEHVPCQFLTGTTRHEIEAQLKSVFEASDVDHNEVLDAREFEHCLEIFSTRHDLRLTSREITQLSWIADQNDDQVIDYAEFIQFAYDHLLRLIRETYFREQS